MENKKDQTRYNWQAFRLTMHIYGYRLLTANYVSFVNMYEVSRTNY